MKSLLAPLTNLLNLPNLNQNLEENSIGKTRSKYLLAKIISLIKRTFFKIDRELNWSLWNRISFIYPQQSPTDNISKFSLG